MILRRFRQHVSEQNWFAVGLDILVVIFGVYIGIYLGELANERAIRSEVGDALVVVRVQLEDDLKTVDRIIEYRTEKVKQPVALLGKIDQAGQGPEFGDGLLNAYERMFTFFPKSSGYNTMKDSGFLPRLDDAELLEALAYLFDQVYVRHVIVADESDQNTYFYTRNVVAVYWSHADNEYIGEEKIARARIANALERLREYSEWYVQFLGETVRPAIVDALAAIDAYQGGKTEP